MLYMLLVIWHSWKGISFSWKILSSSIWDLWIEFALLFSLNISGEVTVQRCPFLSEGTRSVSHVTLSWPRSPLPFTTFRQKAALSASILASLHSHLVAHERQVGRARPDLVHRLHLHSWVERYSSFCYADRKQQAVTQHPHCTSRRKTSEQLQKEKYVWVLIAQHVLCLVSNTAKKEVAFGQKASAHQQNALKAQLWGGKNGYGCLWWCDGAWWCMVWARRAAQEWPCPSVRGLDTWRDDRQYWSAWQTMLSALHQNCFQSAA